jgi:hypothetical protein
MLFQTAYFMVPSLTEDEAALYTIALHRVLASSGYMYLSFSTNTS